ncbi:RNA polymerase sigma factor [Heyndrickxia vini]|uniref:Sigma-70 family RNA polymerase sigma factor n=1 Tax=Heyndrickxia vini TaxID=1476025 RepID=A0ABX7E1A8_9BACI|nr:sigma-70 family RNA polymerase sigma factor [Heyndrickxia vini]QQZ09317.1 sigma-70 family RNA polymerase sigma factor [Heyndrickxia vini]
MYSNDFEEIYNQYSDKVYSYLFLLVKNKELAEDLTQETFYKAYKKRNTFKSESNISTWLIKIGRNLTYDFFRRKKLLKFLPIEKYQEKSIYNETPPEILIKGEEVEMVYRAINSLKLEYQEVIILRKIKEFSIKETSTILGWSEVRVKNTTVRAIAALRKNLSEKGAAFDENFIEIG